MTAALRRMHGHMTTRTKLVPTVLMMSADRSAAKVTGTLACLMTGCIAGMLVDGE